jgi:hypothetical protein
LLHRAWNARTATRKNATTAAVSGAGPLRACFT